MKPNKMAADYHILLNLKTCEGYENYGKFNIGKSRETALALYHSLHGNEDDSVDFPLQIELREYVTGLPMEVKLLNCTLEELGTNCKLITREVFKQINMKEMDDL
ncbi:MAG: hypothetical protein M3N30_13505 [Bacteroidota bacterium]|nr:hypothetical protein [Bacteroidota bacterium]